MTEVQGLLKGQMNQSSIITSHKLLALSLMRQYAPESTNTALGGWALEQYRNEIFIQLLLKATVIDPAGCACQLSDASPPLPTLGLGVLRLQMLWIFLQIFTDLNAGKTKKSYIWSVWFQNRSDSGELFPVLESKRHAWSHPVKTQILSFQRITDCSLVRD